jgi:putative tricarboxylic transport membrane protein
MGDLVSNLSLGFSVALTPLNLGLAFLGCLVGTLVGVLPGVGPIATIAMLLPITFGLDPTGALIMLAGIYYGAQYGGSTTAILVNIPGEATSVVTALDGHQMARQGRAGVALGVAAIGSFFAGTVATLVIAALGAPLTSLALVFGPTEYFSLMIMGLVFAVVLARGSILKAIAMILVGVLLSTVGTDLETGEERMTFGLPFLSDGIDFAVLAMGIFGIAEIMRNLDHTETRDVVRQAIGRLLPNREDFRQSYKPVLRGTVIGAILGILPGNGAVLGPFASYTLEKKLAKDPRRFGRGAIEGVAGPESANNAGAQTSFIPLLTLGIPPNAVMALMVGAMTIHGIIPGPQVMTKNPTLFWGMIASMWVGNLMLLVINLPLVGLWVRLLKVPYRLMFPAILMFCCIGIYSINSLPTDVMFIGLFGLVGYTLMKFGFEPAPMLLGFVLGKLMEENLRRALIISRGEMATFVTHPISAGLLAVATLLLIIALLPSIRKGRDEVFTE